MLTLVSPYIKYKRYVLFYVLICSKVLINSVILDLHRSSMKRRRRTQPSNKHLSAYYNPDENIDKIKEVHSNLSSQN